MNCVLCPQPVMDEQEYLCEDCFLELTGTYVKEEC